MSAQSKLRLGEVLLARGGEKNIAAALAQFEAARDQPETLAGALLGIGSARLAQGTVEQDPTVRREILAAALVAFRQAQEIAPRSVPARTGAGRALMELGRAEEGVSEFIGAVALASDDPSRLAELARAQAIAGLLTDADRTYQEALKRDPGNGVYLSEQADVMIKLGRSEEARANLERAARMYPSDPRIALRLAKLYYQAGGANLVSAREKFWEAARLGKASADPAQRAEALYFLSRIETETGRGRDNAIATADEAVALVGADTTYRMQACLARIRYMNWDAARTGEANAHCGDSSAPSAAQSKLLRGMMELRLAHFALGDDKKRRWEDAYRAFSSGLSINSGAEPTATRARLELGVGLAQYCIGFAGIGREIIERADKSARAFFDSHRVAQCATY